MVPQPAQIKINQLYLNLSKTEGKLVILSHSQEFNDSYIPVNCLPDFPKPLTDLFDPSTVSLLS